MWNGNTSVTGIRLRQAPIAIAVRTAGGGHQDAVRSRARGGYTLTCGHGWTPIHILVATGSTQGLVAAPSPTCTFAWPAAPVRLEMPARDTSEAICLHASDTDAMTVASSPSMLPFISSCDCETSKTACHGCCMPRATFLRVDARQRPPGA